MLRLCFLGFLLNENFFRIFPCLHQTFTDVSREHPRGDTLVKNFLDFLQRSASDFRDEEIYEKERDNA